MKGPGLTAAALPGSSQPEPAVLGGARPGKIGMWIFLVTDGMGFGAMLIAYGVLRARAAAWPPASARLSMPLVAAMTFVLLASSLAALLSVAAARQGQRGASLGWLAATIACGAAFLGGQALEYHHLVTGTPAMGLTTDLFASTFYAVTGYHGLHVLAGVVYLAILLARGLRATGGVADPDTLEVAALFWHFVDLAWVPIFTFVYLFPAR
jgi:heme/copper-type cytochrome/quinol oxidase subunit 3